MSADCGRIGSDGPSWNPIHRYVETQHETGQGYLRRTQVPERDNENDKVNV